MAGSAGSPCQVDLAVLNWASCGRHLSSPQQLRAGRTIWTRHQQTVHFTVINTANHFQLYLARQTFFAALCCSDKDLCVAKQASMSVCANVRVSECVSVYECEFVCECVCVCVCEQVAGLERIIVLRGWRGSGFMMTPSASQKRLPSCVLHLYYAALKGNQATWQSIKCFMEGWVTKGQNLGASVTKGICVTVTPNPLPPSPRDPSPYPAHSFLSPCEIPREAKVLATAYFTLDSSLAGSYGWHYTIIKTHFLVFLTHFFLPQHTCRMSPGI